MIDAHKPALRTSKRLIVCCDGTWMNSDNGYEKPSFRNPKGTLQVPSNVTRISRCFKRRCKDGVDQVISYESGVGTGSNTVDEITGGAFGLGLSEVCAIICGSEWAMKLTITASSRVLLVPVRQLHFQGRNLPRRLLPWCFHGAVGRRHGQQPGSANPRGSRTLLSHLQGYAKLDGR